MLAITRDMIDICTGMCGAVIGLLDRMYAAAELVRRHRAVFPSRSSPSAFCSFLHGGGSLGPATAVLIGLRHYQRPPPPARSVYSVPVASIQSEVLSSHCSWLCRAGDCPGGGLDYYQQSVHHIYAIVSRYARGRVHRRDSTAGGFPLRIA